MQYSFFILENNSDTSFSKLEINGIVNSNQSMENNK